MKTLKDYVDDLPEIYQNIYGHPEFDNEISRNCRPRESLIMDVIHRYQKYSGKKNLKILDLGCAQGYYSLSLSKEGHSVEGIDFLDKNIIVCNALKKENNLNCSFKLGELTLEMAQAIPDGKYDVIMLYSVIHHIAHANGFDYARKLMEVLVNKSAFLLTELAVKEEPLYWNDNLPASYDEWFVNVPFYKEQFFFETHLSKVKRPFIFASSRYCYINNKFYSIDSFSTTAYEGKQEIAGKRYYICDHKSTHIKYFRNVINDFKVEINEEIRFLKDNSDLDFTPELVYCENTDQIDIEITKIRYGKNLFELLRHNVNVNIDKIFNDVLLQCIELENRGYYHGDLRPWNIIVFSSGGGSMIDFGNVQHEKVDKVMRKENNNEANIITVYDSFIITLYDCLIRNTFSSITKADMYQSSLLFDFDILPDKYSAFIKKYILLRHEKDITFNEIKDLFEKIVINGSEIDFSTKDRLTILENQMTSVDLQKCNVIDNLINQHDIISLKTEVAQAGNYISDQLKQREDQQNQLVKQQGHLEDQLIQLVDQQNKLKDQLSKYESQLSNYESQLSKYESQLVILEDQQKQLDQQQNQIKELNEEIYIMKRWIIYRIYNKIRDAFRKKK